MVYKIVTKVIGNKLKSIMPLIIDLAQSAFIPRHLIMDNIIFAFELIHSMKKKIGGQKRWLP